MKNLNYVRPIVRSLRWRAVIYLLTASRPPLGPTQPSIQRVLGALSLGVKRPGREAAHSPPSIAEVENVWSYTFTPQYAFMVWRSVKKVISVRRGFIAERWITLHFAYLQEPASCRYTSRREGYHSGIIADWPLNHTSFRYNTPTNFSIQNPINLITMYKYNAVLTGILSRS